MKRGLTLLLPFVLIAVAGCPRQQISNENGPAQLKAFTSTAELKQYLTEQYRRANTRGFAGGLFGGVPAAMEDGANTPTSSGGHSGTNLQEEGVDESDVIKTDGQYLYILANQKLDIVQATPPDAMAVAGHVDLDLPGTELYLIDSTAIVLGQPSYYLMYGVGVAGGTGIAVPATAQAGQSAPPSGAVPGDPGAGTEDPWLSNGMTFDVYVVDVSAPDAPSQLKKYSFEGQLITSRMVGAKLYLVSTTWPDITEPSAVAAADVQDILPKYRLVSGGQESVKPLVAVGDVYHPVNPDGYSLVNVTTIDTADLDADPVSTTVMAGYGVVYASTQALYLSSPNYDTYGLARQNTDIHKFDLTGESAAYVASGRVLGWLLNQFSMGEKDGFLRLATTEDPVTPVMGIMASAPGAVFSAPVQASQNHVFVLEQVDNKLQVAGQIDGIAKGEELYAARFVGDRGFLVTFKKIDPLFTVDLSDPRDPKLAGELKVPGYSEYIHMLDEDHLLTIGKDAQDEGGFAWYLGLKLSIFDVTDLAKPALLHSQTIGVRGTDSEALRNHKAFTYYNGLLAFPIDLYEGDATPPEYGNYTFGGLMVYRASVADGFEYLGRIATVNQSEPWYWNYNQWTRGVFIGESVYAACEHDVKSAAVADMSALQSSVDLP